MSDIIANVTPNTRTAAAANDRALTEALARWRAAPPGSRIVLPLGQIWLNQALVLGEADVDLEFECRGDRDSAERCSVERQG